MVWTYLAAIALVPLNIASAQHPDVIPGATIDATGVVSASITQILEKPEVYLDTKVAFTGRFHRFGEIYQPFFTVFDNFSHTNMAAWDEATDISSKEGYLNSFNLLYIDRSKAALLENAFSLHPFQRFNAVGVVRSIFDGKPFVDVVELEPQDMLLTAAGHKNKAIAGPAKPAAPAPMGSKATSMEVEPEAKKSEEAEETTEVTEAPETEATEAEETEEA